MTNHAAPAIFSFDQHYIGEARALWVKSPGVGLSEADKPHALAAYLARNRGTSFVAVEAGHVIGTILCGHDGRRGLIHHLVVAPGNQRKGLGRRLLRAGLDGLRRERIDKCHLLVFRSNEPGLAFWRAVNAEERLSLALFSLATDKVE